MKKYLFIGLSAFLGFFSCTRNQEIEIPESNLSIIARSETPTDSKTVVEGKTHVYWEPGDEIAAFLGNKSAKFSTDITEPSATATFKGTFGDSSWPEELDLWAVYPYSEDASFDGETITTVLPSEQIARAGSFGKDMNLAIAHSTSNTLQFYNICGGSCFSVYNKGIRSVSFKSINGESLAGKIQVAFDPDGEPIVKSVLEGADEVTVYAPDGEFVPGERYFALFLPQELAAGVVVSYNVARYSAGLTLEIYDITRRYFGVLDQWDERFYFGDYAVPERVNLGLSVMWGSFNIGASEPAGYGQYYSWGESVPKKMYDWTNYRWGLGVEYDDIFKYCSVPLLGWDEFTDDLVTLVPEDDVAHLLFGEKWRMPTKEEWEELVENCTRSIDWVDGVRGCRFTSNITGESIFLPAAGGKTNSSLDYAGTWGYYWSSTLFAERPDLAYIHEFDTIVLGNWRIDSGLRHAGYSIRPVYAE